MLKEKWRKLILREKVLFISGILVILSIPLSVVTLYFIASSMTFFIISTFYNLYKLMEMANVSITEAIDTDMKKAENEWQQGKKVSAVVRSVALPFAFGVGMPMVFILLLYLWIAI